MPLPAPEIQRLILEAIPDAEIELTDLAGDDDHFSVTVTSSAFSGLTRIAQHKRVYDALKGGMGGTLHALQVKTVGK